MTTATIESIETPDGVFTLISDEKDRVLASGWTDEQQTVLSQIHPRLRPGRIIEAATSAGENVRAFYAGDIAAIEAVSVLQTGTPFQQAGWEMLRRITPGEPLSYADFAAALDRPMAVRAAASICARNAVPLFIPCHRVLRSDGSLGGFGWGTTIKDSLLRHESANADFLRESEET